MRAWLKTAFLVLVASGALLLAFFDVDRMESLAGWFAAWVTVKILIDLAAFVFVCWVINRKEDA